MARTIIGDAIFVNGEPSRSHKGKKCVILEKLSYRENTLAYQPWRKIALFVVIDKHCGVP